jgi:hypothetical protein
MAIDSVDWLVDAPIPGRKCGEQAAAKVTIQMALKSIASRYFGT